MVRIPSTLFSTSFDAESVSSIYIGLKWQHLTAALPAGDPRLDSGPDQLRPPGISRVGRVVAVGRHQLGPEWNFAPARGVEVDQLRAVNPARALERVVEGDGQLADRLAVLASTKPRRHRQIGDQIHHD